MRKTLILAGIMAATLTLAVVAATGSDVLAARGSGGAKGKPTPPPAPSTAAVQIVSASPVPVGDSPTFHATGYASGQLVYMVMSGYIKSDGVYADSSGSVTYTFREGMWSPGSYTFTTTLLNGVNQASVSFTVR